eukprot:Nitzschia sp. Nitz4//scaffold239_size30010//14829//17923//NITZ4_008012-RA/size30010-snap-gene-0.32-mRNA-1//1//CDS//3329543568//8582//frame0
MFGIARRGQVVTRRLQKGNVRKLDLALQQGHVFDFAASATSAKGAQGLAITKFWDVWNAASLLGQDDSKQKQQQQEPKSHLRMPLGTSFASSWEPAATFQTGRISFNKLDPLSINRFFSESANSLERLWSSVPAAVSSRSLYPEPWNLGLQYSSIQPAIQHSAATNNAAGSKRYFSTGPYKTSAKIPTPKSAPSPSSSFNPQAILSTIVETTWSLAKWLVVFCVNLPANTWFFMTNSKARGEKIQEIKDVIKHEVDHYWTGTKLLMADVRTARDLIGRTLSGSTLTRRERKQLLRTVSDLFRIVPFSMFILIPLAEFALPFALKVFPNMLPSTFQDSLKAEENMKRELQSRIAMAQFFQETLSELAKEQKRIAVKRTNDSPDNEIASKQQQSAESMLEFLDHARQGEMMPPDIIVQYAKYFQDDLTLDNMPRMQLVNMCRYMDLQPYGADAFLRFQLRHRIRSLKEDDQRIIWEGIDSLTKMELREACQERGMRATGLSKEAYKRSLQQWLDLSVNKSVPISLLIMSRTFFLQEEAHDPIPEVSEAKNVASLVDAISGMDKEVLNEVLLEVATSEERKSSTDIQKIKLEVVTQQNEMIREEREAAEKKKKAAEKAAEALASELAEETGKPAEVTVTVNLDPHEKSTPTVTFEETKTVVPEPVKAEVPTPEEEAKDAEILEEDKEHELSTAEMDAISHLLTDDPVSKEREDLKRIKSAMGESEEGKSAEKKEAAPVKPIEDTYVTLEDVQVAEAIHLSEKQAADEAEKATTFSTTSEIPEPKAPAMEEVSEEETPKEESSEEVVEDEEEAEDPVVRRLKKRIASMVDKIEVQMSNVELKIGDKLHILDKDKDGVLTLEEMAAALQHVLKRKLEPEEAMEIAAAIDENEDGVFTVQELIKWIETNKLVQLAEAGADADMDRILESKVSSEKEELSSDLEEQVEEEVVPQRSTKQS